MTLFRGISVKRADEERGERGRSGGGGRREHCLQCVNVQL